MTGGRWRGGALGAAAVLAAVGACASPPIAAATFPGTPGRIVLGGSFGQDPVTTAAPDGTDVREVLAGGGHPRWSPDGTTLLYGAPTDPANLDAPHALWRASADGSRPSVVLSPMDAFPVPAPTGDREWAEEPYIQQASWAPDGRSIVLTLEREWFSLSGDGGRALQVRTFDTVTRRSRRLRAGSGAEWSPRGDRIAFLSADGNYDETGIDVLTMRPDGTRVRVLHRLDTTRGVVRDADSLSFSPDGRRLAYIERRRPLVNDDGTSSRRTVSYLRVVDVATGRVARWARPVTRDAVAVTWRPDGRRLAYIAGRSLFTVRPNGTGRRRLMLVGAATQVDWQALPGR